MKIVLGLGNPGKKYECTRHNLGFLVLNEIASTHAIGFAPKRSLESLIGRWKVGEEEVLLVKPQIYMNHSGRAAGAVLQKFPVGIQNLVVVHDDLDLRFGQIRIRARGSHAGHRGVQSILDAVGEESFLRVRLGIGRPAVGLDATEYVLERFSAEERSRLQAAISRAADAVACVLQEGPKAAMERFNRVDSN
ncbi:MAG: aminoacyl-tRNA hydrolase [Candidatus Binatia bacterium]